VADRGQFWLGNELDDATGEPGSDRLVVGSADGLAWPSAA